MQSKEIDLRSGNYFVFSLGGRRLFNTASRHHHGKSFSSSVPSKRVIFFLQGPPLEPSVMIEGGEGDENSKGGYTMESFSTLLSASSFVCARLLVDKSFLDIVSPLLDACDPILSFLLLNQ